MPAFGFVAAFALVLLAPSALYLSWVHPGWSWMYFFDPSSMVAALGGAWAVFLSTALFLGWVIGGKCVQTSKPGWAAFPLALGFGGIGVCFALLHGRFGVYASYAAYAQGGGIGLMEVKLGYVLVVLALALGATSAHVALALARDARRVRAR